MNRVAIIMGSHSDLKVMKAAEEALALLKVEFKTQIISAHRTPKKMEEFAKSAHLQGYKIIIAGAGGAAHLPGMVACLTTLPVIGVPVNIGPMKGLDSLLSIVQMPKGIPVATVAIDNAFNAGLLAAQMLAVNDEALTQRLITYRKAQTKKVSAMNRQLKARNS